MKNIGNVGFMVFIIIFIIFGYFWYQRIADSADGLSAAEEGRVLSREFLVAVNKLRTIKISTSFFESEAFRSLQDFTPVVEIPEDIGRNNPFLPLQ